MVRLISHSVSEQEHGGGGQATGSAIFLCAFHLLLRPYNQNSLNIDRLP